MLATKFLKSAKPGDFVKDLPWHLISLFFCALVLAGRYDWTTGDYAKRSYILSVFFLTLTAFTFSGLSYQILKKRTRWSTLFIGALLAIPHHFLGFDKSYYHLHHRFLWDWRDKDLPFPKFEWFPEAFQNLPNTPYEGIFFFTLALLGLAGIYFIHKQTKRSPLLLILILALMLFEGWIHQGFRSPYTYVPHYEQPPENQHYFHYYLFPEAKGAVNFDFGNFRLAEEIFIGHPRHYSILGNRTYSAYLVSQLSSFINPYYAWMGFNYLLWGLALLALFFYAKETFDERVAHYSVLFFGASLCILLYLAQPMVYVAANTSVIFLVFIHSRLLSGKKPDPLNVVLFGISLTLFLLTYEGQPWIVGLPVLAWANGKNLKGTFLGIGIGVIGYAFFLWLLKTLPGIENAPSLAPIGGHPIDNILRDIREVRLGSLFTHGLKCFRGYARCCLHAYQIAIIPVLFALFSKTVRPYLKLLFALQLPAFLTYSLMEMGGTFYYTQSPRMVQSAYVGIYLLAGLGIIEMAKWFSKKFSKHVAAVVCKTVIALALIVPNLDVWGIPAIYYVWFYRRLDYSTVKTTSSLTPPSPSAPAHP